MKKQAALLLVLAVAALATVFSCDPKVTPVDTLTVNRTSISFEAEDASTAFVSVTTAGNWTASASPSWIHLDKTSGTGDGSVGVTVEANPGEDRTGTITFSGAENATVAVSQKGKNIVTLVANPDTWDKEKRASTTYQLLIYSFADSDGDGIGDFKGIQNKLDYLDEMGVCALWLSPAHPSDSYHAYDVTDYYDVNPLYGTVDDFKNLIEAAHQHGIKIYMDYVLNHSGKGNAWFKEALADPSSPYRDYYFFSTNPRSDYSKFPMLKGTTYNSDEWKATTSGSPKLKITKTEEEVTQGNSPWNLWVWKSGQEGKAVAFTDKGNGSYSLVMEIDGNIGLLVRKNDWEAKFGASGNGTVSEGQTMNLVADGGDLSFTGSGRYRIDLSGIPNETLYYMGCFSDWMPDLNYGDVSQAENNACFQDLAGSADKWINMGVDGFRLDAVKHICGGISSFSHSSNQTLLKKWYEHCNATYQAAGHDDNIFMVAEEWDGHSTEKTYYKSLTSCFEFEYWGVLRNAVSGSAGNYVSTVTGYINDHKALRQDAITSIFMTNHDKTSLKKNSNGQGTYRAADDLGKDLAKEKQAAAMLLTTAGKPFVYQGEELGYWGDATGGDEYIRTPILWDKAGKDCAKKGVNNKVDNSMLKADISVEAQKADAGSLLNVYSTFGKLRCIYPALADGTMTAAPMNGSSIAAWYMTGTDGSKMLVIHNTAGTAKSFKITDDTSHPVALLGTATMDHDNLTLEAHSSVVFKL